TAPGSVRVSLVPAAVLGAVVALLVLSHSLPWNRRPLAAPLGYSNADAALYVECSIAGLMLMLCGRAGLVRILGGSAALAFGLLPLLMGTLAAATVVISVPTLALVATALWGTLGSKSV